MISHAIFGVRIDDGSLGECERMILRWIGERSGPTRVIVTPNPEFLLAARSDLSFRDALNRSDLSLPDGVGLRFAIPALTGARLDHRHTGVDTLETLARLCASQEVTLALVGGNPGVAERAALALASRVHGLNVRGIDPGFVPDNAPRDEMERRVDSIKRETRGAAVVAVGLGMGKQERLMGTLRDATGTGGARVLIGVGGAFDMLAGMKPRAPGFLRRAGLEWAWRLAVEPSRVRRIFQAAVVFPAVVVWTTLRQRRFLRACQAAIPEIIRQIAQT